MLRFGETKETKKKVLCRKNPIKMACYMVILLLNIYISFLYIKLLIFHLYTETNITCKYI